LLTTHPLPSTSGGNSRKCQPYSPGTRGTGGGRPKHSLRRPEAGGTGKSGSDGFDLSHGPRTPSLEAISEEQPLPKCGRRRQLDGGLPRGRTHSSPYPPAGSAAECARHRLSPTLPRAPTRRHLIERRRCAAPAPQHCRRWRVDRLAGAVDWRSGKLRPGFAAMAKYYGVAVEAGPPRRATARAAPNRRPGWWPTAEVSSQEHTPWDALIRTPHWPCHPHHGTLVTYGSAPSW
jgi:hypothetical protein